MAGGNKSFLIFMFFIFSLTTAYAEVSIKEPNVAGAFYPGDPRELSEMIDGFMAGAHPEPMKGKVFCLILPHAGYGFSGPTAALGYKLIKDASYKTVVVIGTSHYYPFAGASIYASGIFNTPLGGIEIDSEFTEELLDKENDIIFEPRAFEKEHSVEVQLPFLQKCLKDFKIVPIVMGDCPLYVCEKLSERLRKAIGARQDVLIIVSTDMYHGYDYEECQKMDKLTLSLIQKMDEKALYEGLRANELQLCGGFGTVSALILSKELGHKTVCVLGDTNSSIVTGKKMKGIWTVGYASCAIDREEACLPAGREKNMLNKEERKKLLEIARKSIETYLKTGKKIELKEKDPLLSKENGAFVTLRMHGELRGCIGNLVGRGPLYLTIRDMAVEAATGDPRFTSLGPEELNDVDIEISVLSPLKQASSADEIELGKHGVLIKKGFNSGVFLPQVATETGWSKEEFLTNLCVHKAGLAGDAWKDKTTEIYIFTAEIFSEKE